MTPNQVSQGVLPAGFILGTAVSEDYTGKERTVTIEWQHVLDVVADHLHASTDRAIFQATYDFASDIINFDGKSWQVLFGDKQDRFLSYLINKGIRYTEWKSFIEESSFVLYDGTTPVVVPFFLLDPESNHGDAFYSFPYNG